MATLPILTALRVATYDLVQLTKNKEEVQAISDEILQNPQVAKTVGVTNRVIACLQEGPGVLLYDDNHIKHINAAKVFFRAVEALAGPGALGLDQKVALQTRHPNGSLSLAVLVTRRFLELHCPLFGRNISERDFIEGASEETLAEIATLFERGTAQFSHILEAREIAYRYQCPALLEETWNVISGSVGNLRGAEHVSDLFKLWVFALKTEDQDLKRRLLVYTSPESLEHLPQSESMERIELLALEAMRLSYDRQKERLKRGYSYGSYHLFQETTGFSLYLWEKILTGHYGVTTYDCVCEDDQKAAELAQMLSSHGQTSGLKTFHLMTARESVLQILIPAVIMFTKVSKIDVHYITENPLHQSLGYIANALRNNKFLECLRIWIATYPILEGLKAFAAALQENKIVKKLEFYSSSQQPTDKNYAEFFAKATQNHPTLEDFTTNFMGLDWKGVQAWSETLQSNRSLTSLQLDIEDDGHLSMNQLARALRDNLTLKNLDLKLKCDVLPFSFEGSTNQTLRSLTITAATVRTGGLAHFLRRNKSLRRLSLQVTRIEDEEALILALQGNSTLQELHLPYSGDRMIEAVATILKTQSLRILSLVPNGMTDQNLRTLAESLKHNHSLLSLGLSGNTFTFQAISDFAHQLKTNQTLMSLTLYNRLPPEERVQIHSIFSELGFKEEGCFFRRKLPNSNKE